MSKEAIYRIKTVYTDPTYYYSVDFDWDKSPLYACEFSSEEEAMDVAIKRIENEYIIIEKFYKL